MSNLKVSLADIIANKSYDAYCKQPKKGKLMENEWTVLSCILQHNKTNDDLKVVSLGTGSKCIGAIKMSPKGNILNDSHAEVMARRGFLVYLYNNIEKCLEGKNSIFIFENNKFNLKENIEFFFYSSQLPCGDACIMPKFVESDLVGAVLQSNKRLADTSDNADSETIVKKQKTDSGDIHRTGAKCLPHCEQDMKDPGERYHLLGQVRTKPGRGERTLSVSCSDKMARWIHLGINGSLLDMLLAKPIFVKLFVFGGGVPYSEESIERAFLKRNADSEVTLECIPEFQQSTYVFPYNKKEKIAAAHGSIVWINTPDNMCSDVAIQGRRLGVTKKNATSMTNLLCITKYCLYKMFISILLKNENLKKSICEEAIESVPYNVMKSKSSRYIEKWMSLKKKFFGTWTNKPDIFNFTVDIT